MKRLRAAIAERRDAEALNRDWDSYVRSVGRPPADRWAGTSVVLRHLHRLDDAPLPDPVFLARTWGQVRERVLVSEVTTDHAPSAAVLVHGLRRHTLGGNRRTPSMRVAVAALGLAVLALTLFMGRLLPAGGDAPLMASAFASAAPAVGSPIHRIATRQPSTVDAAPNASSGHAQLVQVATELPAHTATPGTPSR